MHRTLLRVQPAGRNLAGPVSSLSSDSDQASVDSGEEDILDAWLVVLPEQEVTPPVTVPIAVASPTRCVPLLPQTPECAPIPSSRVTEPLLVQEHFPSDPSVASEGSTITEGAPLRRTTRKTAGYHSNAHHLPATMGGRGGIVNSQVTVIRNDTTLFRPWR